MTEATEKILRTIKEVQQKGPDILIPKKNVIFDATVMSTLQGCGRLVDLRFNHNLVSINGKSNSLEAGLVFHKYAEYYYGHIIKGFKKSDAHGYGMAAAETYARGCPFCTNFISTVDSPIPKCGHKINEFEGLRNTPAEPEKQYQIGWKWVLETCEQYYDFYKNDFWVPLEVEVVKSRVLYEDDEIRVLWKSKMDLVSDTNQGIYPVDHKTMKQRRDTISLNNQFIGQCIMQNTRSMFINKVGFQKTLKPEERFNRGMVSYSAKRIIEWQGTILPYWAYKLIEYSENEFWAPNYDHCENKYGNCPFIEVCEADPDDREREIKLNFMVGPDWNPRNALED